MACTTLFKDGCHTQAVNQWLEKMLLLPELSQPSIIVMDNARFHNKEQMQEIFKKAGHTMLPLPRYSPDFNAIEQSFAIIKNDASSHQRYHYRTITYV